jgi:hypothetical protein
LAKGAKGIPHPCPHMCDPYSGSPFHSLDTENKHLGEFVTDGGTTNLGPRHRISPRCALSPCTKTSSASTLRRCTGRWLSNVRVLQGTSCNEAAKLQMPGMSALQGCDFQLCLDVPVVHVCIDQGSPNWAPHSISANDSRAKRTPATDCNGPVSRSSTTGFQFFFFFSPFPLVPLLVHWNVEARENVESPCGTLSENRCESVQRQSVSKIFSPRIIRCPSGLDSAATGRC